MVAIPDGDQWHFDTSQFKFTPSRIIDNITAIQELKARNDGVHFLLRCGNALKLKSNVLSSAACYFHRFYMRYSLGPSGYDKIQIATAAIFLASKVEESTRKLRDVAQVCYVKFTGDMELKGADKWMDRILSNESILLDALCFDLIVFHPHEYLSDAFSGGARDSAIWSWLGPLANWDMSQVGLYELAWSVANDSLRTPVCLFFSPRLIACAIFLIALATVEGRRRDSETHQESASRDPTGSEGLRRSHMDVQGIIESNGDASLALANESSRDEASQSMVEEILVGQRFGGVPWQKSFQVDDEDLKELRDVIGNISELYASQESPGINEMPQYITLRHWTSFSDLPQPSGQSRVVSTNNSSPALTLASSATPHRNVEYGSQDFGSVPSADVEVTSPALHVAATSDLSNPQAVMDTDN